MHGQNDFQEVNLNDMKEKQEIFFSFLNYV